MAFIRTVVTTSGARAVQVVQYWRGRQRVLKHLGSAHSQKELDALIVQAQAWLVNPDQLSLEFGDDAGNLDVAVTPPEQLTLIDHDPAPVDHPACPAPVPPAQLAGQVTGTSSQVLYDTLGAVYDGLGLDQVGSGVFRDLVIARVAEPTSLLDTGRVLTDLGVTPVSYSTMRRTLTQVVAQGFRDQIAAILFARARTDGDVTLVLYDVTTLYFEAEHEDDLRKVGYSKERRVDPQVVVGLLVDRFGFPLEIGCFAGNKAETATLIPVMDGFRERHGLAGMAVVADAGMLSASNLKELDQADLRFIVGSRSAKAPHDLTSHFRWNGEAFTDGQIIDTITSKTGKSRGENDPLHRAEPVWDPLEHPGSWRAIWAYSSKRALRDERTLNLQEQRARDVIAGTKTARAPRFVKTSNGSHTLDETSIKRARSLAGLKGYVTNIPAPVMPAAEVIGNYHDLWHVEQSFRMSKTDLRARPMFVRTEDSINAHLTIVFTALAISRTIQQRSGMSIRAVLRQLKPLRSATITTNNAHHTLPPHISDENQTLITTITGQKVTH